MHHYYCSVARKSRKDRERASGTLVMLPFFLYDFKSPHQRQHHQHFPHDFKSPHHNGSITSGSITSIFRMILNRRTTAAASPASSGLSSECAIFSCDTRRVAVTSHMVYRVGHCWAFIKVGAPPHGMYNRARRVPVPKRAALTISPRAVPKRVVRDGSTIIPSGGVGRSSL